MRNYAMTNLTQANPTSPAMSAIRQASLDNKKWILVGAQQAGASPKRMAEIASLPKSTVRRILSNFSRTGIPSTSSPRSHQYKDMAIVEYDSDGNVTNYDDNASTVSSQRLRIQPRAKDLIAYVKAQKALEEAENNKAKTKARSHVNAVASTSHSTPPPSTSEKFLLMTPPQESDTMQRQATTTTMIAPLEKSERRFSLPPSPPLHPAPLDTALPSKSLPPTHEPWTRKDDEVLLKHVFSSVSDRNWTAIENKLQGRHRASICRDRWRKLQAAMLDDQS
ncbi:hypothetical protein INT44_003300 [Umbelopsis vinacea]|uniref:Myb-like domain-containing protein n=1 Tax=Umbelopsis vinacea TaxID=44442 RepID=A0A8H7UME1_9FUNG|nr:hypothetical protein INT44_003300 [Umbelopsis vinacea]